MKQQIWNTFKRALSEDFAYKRKQEGLPEDDAEAHNAALWDIQLLLGQQGGASLADFMGMPIPHRPREATAIPEVLRRERNYEAEEQRRKADRLMAMCNVEQLHVVKTILAALDQPAEEPKCFYLYACGGCGKTFLLDLLLARIRADHGIADKGTVNCSF
jgi:hypothetical protein